MAELDDKYSSKLYLEIKKKHQDAFNKVPTFFAFGSEQFEKCMKERGLDASKDEDLRKIYSIGAGGYILKSDADKFHDFLNMETIEDELYRTGTDNDIIGAYVYELFNHEFMYSYDIDFDMEQCFTNIKQNLMDIAKQEAWDYANAHDLY